MFERTPYSVVALRNLLLGWLWEWGGVGRGGLEHYLGRVLGILYLRYATNGACDSCSVADHSTCGYMYTCAARVIEDAILIQRPADQQRPAPNIDEQAAALLAPRLKSAVPPTRFRRCDAQLRMTS